LLDYAPRDTNLAQVHRHLLTREAVSRNHVVNRRVLVRAKAHRLSPATAPLPFRPLLPSQMKILVSVRTAQKTTDRTYPSGLSIQILPSQFRRKHFSMVLGPNILLTPLKSASPIRISFRSQCRAIRVGRYS
jgi:hypothetical protein